MASDDEIKRLEQYIKVLEESGNKGMAQYFQKIVDKMKNLQELTGGQSDPIYQ